MEVKDTPREFDLEDSDYGHSSLPNSELNIMECGSKVVHSDVKIKSEEMPENIDWSTTQVKHEIQEGFHPSGSECVDVTFSEQNEYNRDLEKSSNIKLECNIPEENVKVSMNKIDYANALEIKQTSDFVKVKQEIEDIEQTELLTLQVNKETHISENLNVSYCSKKLQAPSQKRTSKSIKKTKKWYPCPVCRKKFRSGSTRKIHFDFHFKKCRGICSVCGSMLVNYEEFIHHYCQHTLNKLFKCGICFKAFYIKRLFYVHQQFHIHSTIYDIIKDEIDITCNDLEIKKENSNVTEDNFEKPSLECYLRLKEFTTRSTFLNRTKTHTERPFQCDVCLKSFSLEDTLIRHATIHTGEKLFKCQICHKQFKRKSNLTRHLKIHTGERNFKCDICCKPFGQKSDLARHLQNHNGEKPFKCDMCLKRFTRKAQLNTHLKSYAGEKPFKCDYCSKQFARRSYLHLHLKTHTEKKNFKCDVCFKRFITKHDLTKHVRIHTGDKPFKCEFCLKRFILQGQLSSHLKIHSAEKNFKCDICFRQFVVKTYLIKHLQIHTGEKPFKCDICPKRFTLKDHLSSHLKIHNGKKNFKCDICSKQFTHKSSYTRHLKMHSRENQDLVLRSKQ